MKTLKTFLAENATANDAEKFADKIKAEFLKVFPKGWIAGGYRKNLGESVTIHFGVLNRKKLFNGIEHNDPARHVIYIEGVDGGMLSDKMKMEFAAGGSLTVKPAEGSYMAYDSIKLGARKKSGNEAAILKHLATYFKKVRKTIEDNRDRLAHDID